MFAGWSVGVEMIFYLMLPALLFLLRSGRVRAAVRGGHRVERLRVAPYRRRGGAAEILPTTHLWELPGLRGRTLCLSRVHRDRPAPAPFVGEWRLRRGVRAAAGARHCRSAGTPRRASGLYFAAWALPFAVLCLWQARYPAKLMRTPVAQWVADRSFSIYLLHPVVLALLRRGYQVLASRSPRWGLALPGLCGRCPYGAVCARRDHLPVRRIAGHCRWPPDRGAHQYCREGHSSAGIVP